MKKKKEREQEKEEKEKRSIHLVGGIQTRHSTKSDLGCKASRFLHSLI